MDNTTIKSNLSRILRELMNKNPRTGESVSVKNLSQFLGVSVHTVYFYLSSKTVPDYPQLFNLARYFGVSIDYLLTGQQPENKTIRESLHLSDEAINNLKEWDNDALYLNKLLSDKTFFALFKTRIEKFQDATRDLLKGWEFEDLDKYLYNLCFEGAIEMFAYFKCYFTNYCERIVKATSEMLEEDKAEYPVNEAEEKNGERAK